MENRKVHVNIRKNQLKSLDFKMLDNETDADIFSLTTIEFDRDKSNLKAGEVILGLKIKFEFTDLIFKISGVLNYDIDLKFELNDDNLIGFLETEKEELVKPLLSKCSSYISTLTGDTFVFPLIVPPEEWLDFSEASEVVLKPINL